MATFKIRAVCTIFIASMAFSTTALSQSMFHSLGWVQPSVPLEEVLRSPTLTDEVYTALRHKLIWLQTKDQTLLEAQLEMLTLAEISPFFSERLAQLQMLRENQRYFEYDLIATDTLLAYISYQSLLQENRDTWLYGQGLPEAWAQPNQELVEDLIITLINDDLSSYLDGLIPSAETYKTYQQAINDLQQSMSSPIPEFTLDTVLRLGDTLTHKEVLFARLQLVGLSLDGVDTNLSHYSKDLQAVVKQFQRQHGLTEDGNIGPNTVYWLNYPAEERIRRLALNAERSRLWPTQRDALVMVNLPGFDLNYYYAGKVVFNSKVIVGKIARKTPMLSIKMDALVLNPTWNVPTKIMREDIIPIARNNPSYLINRGIQVIDGWNNPQVIDVTTIQWNKVNARTFPYRMRQLSGSQNALGIYKFNTPNQRAIYLHDTPSKHLFEKPIRAFSSGCIRVKDADLFANALAQTQGFRKQNISPADNRSNAHIQLKARLPVHLIYKTSWIENGQVHFRKDIYGYDRAPKRANLANITD